MTCSWAPHASSNSPSEEFPMKPKWIAGALLLAATAAFWPAKAVADDEAAVQDAVAKAVEYLKRSRQGTFWQQPLTVDHDVGLTALCTLALLEAGTPRGDGTVLNAAKFVRSSLYLLDKREQANTYSLCLAVMLLDRYF